jgi:hypothetical protein
MSLETISKLKNSLNGGVRSNLFKVEITPGAGITLDPTLTQVMCTATSTPEATVGTIEVKHRGRTIYEPGDREPAGEWTATFWMDSEMKLYQAFWDWNQAIVGMGDDIEMDREAAAGGTVKITQLGRDGNALKSWTLHEAWPTKIGENEMSNENENALSTSEITFAADWVELS